MLQQKACLLLRRLGLGNIKGPWSSRVMVGALGSPLILEECVTTHVCPARTQTPIMNGYREKGSRDSGFPSWGCDIRFSILTSPSFAFSWEQMLPCRSGMVATVENTERRYSGESVAPCLGFLLKTTQYWAVLRGHLVNEDGNRLNARRSVNSHFFFMEDTKIPTGTSHDDVTSLSVCHVSWPRPNSLQSNLSPGISSIIGGE